MPIGFDDIVGEVMTARPATIRVFLDFRMGCVGCPISAFHTVDDACKEHGVDRDEFLAALRAVAERGHGLNEELASGFSSASMNSLCGSRTTIFCRLLSTRPLPSQALSVRLTVCSVVPVICAMS